ncbi:MAG: SDR family oxidoreductase [Saprospiraceae bacterium]|nr:SDR family oxidoreductase [Saprospiraceae bacterium]
MLQGKVAIVTGGTKGIGYAIATAMLQENMKVAITGRSQEAADKAAQALGNADQVIGIEADVRNYESQQNAVAKVVEKWGKLDAMIANAGVGHFVDIADMTPQQWQEVIDVNLTGVFFSTKAALPALKESKGYLMTVSSLAGTNFFAKGAAYNASKFGVVGFSQAVMLDVRSAGVKVTTIMPGSVATHFNDHPVTEKEAWKIQPIDIGQMVVDLLRMNPRTLPSKIEVRPSFPPSASK